MIFFDYSIIFFLQHYVSLNEPYAKSNSEYFKTSQVDYFALIEKPTEYKLSDEDASRNYQIIY